MANAIDGQNPTYIVPGNGMTFKAYYDLSQHTPIVDADCSRVPVMAIAGTYFVGFAANQTLGCGKEVGSDNST